MKRKIALVCNNKMALPALSRMLGEETVCAIITADNNAEVIEVFKTLAAQSGVPYYKTTRSSYETILQQMHEALQPEAVYVMTYPWRIPASLLSLPKHGYINFHYGLLPEMRGADPIFEGIRNRKEKAGVTVHLMDERLDTGNILLREEVPVNADMTYGMLSGRLAYAGDGLCNTLTGSLRDGALPAATVQDETAARYWPKVDARTIVIDWESMTSGEIKAMVKALNPIAKGAPTMINGWRVGIVEVSEVTLNGDTSALQPGMVVALDRTNGLLVYCKDGIALNVEVFYSEEGMLPGYKIAYYGIGPGMMFATIPMAAGVPA